MLDLELKAGKKERSRQDDHEDIKDNLRIPQVDLFDLFQVNRCKILDYLLNNSDEKNAVSDDVMLGLSRHSDVVVMHTIFIHKYISIKSSEIVVLSCSIYVCILC